MGLGNVIGKGLTKTGTALRMRNVGENSLLKNLMSHGFRGTISKHMQTTNHSAKALDNLLAPARGISKLYQSPHPVMNAVRTTGRLSTYALGATAMVGLATMNGAMSAASDQMASRYMNDSRYSSKLLNHRVGKAHGNGSLNIGNHTGLSLSLSRSRHG